MSLSETIKRNAGLKKFIHRLLIPKNEHRPRLWVKLLINPLKHTKGKGSKVRWNTRMDVLPFNDFRLGINSVVESYSTINNGVGSVLIGNETIIGMSNVIIGPVQIGNHVMLAQNIVVSGLNHGYSDISIPPALQPVSTSLITIEDEVWIGANSVITAGVTIGRHSVIAAGSVVTKSVPEFAVAAGNPARIIKKYNSETGVWERV